MFSTARQTDLGSVGHRNNDNPLFITMGDFRAYELLRKPSANVLRIRTAIVDINLPSYRRRSLLCPRHCHCYRRAIKK